MFVSLRSRLWLTYALVIGVVLLIVSSALVIFLIRNPVLVRQTRERLSLLSNTVLLRAETLEDLSPEQLRRAVQRADQTFDVRVVVFDPSGKQAVDSRADSEPPVSNLARISADDGLSFRDARGRMWLFDTTTLPEGSTLLLAAPRPRPPLREILGDEFLRPFLRAGLVALALALLLSFWIARWVAAPLQRIAQGAQQVSKGEYHQIPLEGPSEVMELSQAFNDMTARVKTSRQSQRDFVANVSHELKTPLTSIQGFAQAIKDGTAETKEEVFQAAEVIHSEAGRMHSMVIDLLDLARIDAGTVDFQHQPVDLSVLLQGVVERSRPLARQNQIELLLQVDDIGQIIADGDRLSQVFSNLLDNAFKFTPPGGRVTLRAREELGMVEVAVEDTGPGLEPDEQERVFERFYQVDRSRPGGKGRGAGLGLAIAKEIVEAHQGEIFFQSNPEKGSVFIVKLPLASLNDAKAPALQAEFATRKARSSDIKG